jgi:hypothetical protein
MPVDEKTGFCDFGVEAGGARFDGGNDGVGDALVNVFHDALQK